MSEPILCYVDGPWAYFTTRPLAEQWGDGWDDAPYEHNSGPPYEWQEGADSERWEIVRVAFESPLVTPCDMHLNSPYSVEDINRGVAAWLAPMRGERSVKTVIPAGTSLGEFKRLIHEMGGAVYVRDTDR